MCVSPFAEISRLHQDTACVSWATQQRGPRPNVGGRRGGAIRPALPGTASPRRVSTIIRLGWTTTRCLDAHLPANEYWISGIGGQISPGRTIAAEGCRGVELGRGKKEMVIW